MKEILAKLNKEQLSAVIHDNGPLLIVAGAGTGKTTVLINRLLYLITEKKINSDNILVVTFTEKGSGELEERADKALPYGCTDLWINTFHALADRILREHGLDIGLPTDFKVLSQTEQWIFFKKNLAAFQLDYYQPLGNPNKFISELLRHFSHLKDENISAADYLAYANGLEQNQDVILSGAQLSVARADAEFDARGKLDVDKIKELANAFHVYNQLLLDNRCLDFGDLILYVLKLFKERPDILRRYQEKFTYIMVDEFQDTNWSQYELIKILAAPKNNLVAVGDDDQSIFKFRGASLSNILQFKDDYPTAKEVVLTRNYRSGQPILDRAYDLISHNNPNRLEARLGLNKKLTSVVEGGEARYLLLPDIESEAMMVGELIKEAHRDGSVEWSDMAILVRANATADRFVDELKRQNIPAHFVSLRGLYHKPIIMDVLAYLRLLDDYHESGALLRVLDWPIFKINHWDLISILRFARTKLWSLFEALNNLSAIPKLSPETRINGEKLLSAIKQHTLLAEQHRLSRLYAQIVRDVFLPFLNEGDREPFVYLNQFYKKITAFEAADPSGLLPDFLELLAWEMEAGDTGAVGLLYEDVDVVKIMTVHSAKGLEFKNVFVVDAVDKRFPTISRGEAIPVPDDLIKESDLSKEAHLEEERRLFYVAMTRAKNNLIITGAANQGGVTLKKPSRFITEAGLSAEIFPVTDLTRLEREVAALEQPIKPRPNFGHVLPGRFSFSQLESFDHCPWSYWRDHILKIPVAPNPHMTFGRVIHTVLRDWLSVLLSGGQIDLFGAVGRPDLSWERLKKIYDSHWDDGGYVNREEAEAFRRLGQKMLKDLQTDFSTAPPSQVLYLEKKFLAKIGGHVLECVIDRVDQLPDGTVEIVDYKTGQAKIKPTFEDKRQLLLYQLAWEQLADRPISRLTYYYLKTGDKVSFVAKPAELEKIQLWIINTIKAIADFDFSAKPSDHHCSYCDRV